VEKQKFRHENHGFNYKNSHTQWDLFGKTNYIGLMDYGIGNTFSFSQGIEGQSFYIKYRKQRVFFSIDEILMICFWYMSTPRVRWDSGVIIF